MGGTLHPSLANIFKRLDGMVESMDRRIKTLTGSLNVNTSSQDRNATATRGTANAANTAAAASAKLTEARKREESATKRAGAEHTKLQKMLQSAGKFVQSDRFSQGQQAAGLGMVAAAQAIPVAARQGAGLENQILQAIITDGAAVTQLGPTREKLAGLASKDKTGQTMTSLAEGLNVFTSANMDLDESMKRLHGAGRVATATGSSVADIARTELSMKTMFGIMGKDAEDTAAKTKRAWNILATAGKEGSFELRNMAQELTEIGSRAQTMGMTGERNLSFVAASLQAQVKNAGDPRTAANNMVNFMDKLNGAPDFAENAKKLGIDIVQLRREAAANGPDGKNVMELFTERFQAVMDRTPEANRGSVMGELVGDRQAREGLKAQLLHAKMIAEIQKRGLDSAEKDVVSEDFEKASIATDVSWKSISSSMEKIGQAATLAFEPTLRHASGVLEHLANWTLSIATGKKELAGYIYPFMMIGGSILGMGMKFKLLGNILTNMGGATAGGFLARFGAVLVRGMGVLGAVVVTAILSWEIGKAIGNQIAPTFEKWHSEITGLEDRIREMNRPAHANNMDATSLSNLQGGQAQTTRENALKKWEIQLAADKAELTKAQATVDWSFFATDADQIKVDQLKSKIALGEANAANIKGQMAREASGGSAIGTSPEAIAAAQARLTNYENIASGKTTQEGTTIQQAKDYAAGLRAQLAAANATGTTLQGAANSSNVTTTLQVDVTGATAPGAGEAVAAAVEAKLQERDRETARAYRGTVSTGALGD